MDEAVDWDFEELYNKLLPKITLGTWKMQSTPRKDNMITPGPWKWTQFGNLVTERKVSDTTNNVVVWSPKHGFDNESDKRLIEASPELFVACQALLKTCSQSSWGHWNNPPEGEQCWCKSCSKDYAREVINKVENEENY